MIPGKRPLERLVWGNRDIPLTAINGRWTPSFECLRSGDAVDRQLGKPPSKPAVQARAQRMWRSGKSASVSLRLGSRCVPPGTELACPRCPKPGVAAMTDNKRILADNDALRTLARDGSTGWHAILETVYLKDAAILLDGLEE